MSARSSDGTTAGRMSPSTSTATTPPAPASPARRRVSDDFAGDLEAIRRIGAVDKILHMVCHTTGLGFSAVARVTETRWVACAVRDLIAFGLQPGGELEIATTICNEIRDSGQLVVIDDATIDPTFCNHPTPRHYGFRSYISVPINLPDGRFFGTLCAIDPKPARVNTPEVINTVTLFAELIAMHLAAQERMAAAQRALMSEREAAQFRDQFIAVLGHDLRNPLGAIQSGVQLLELLPHDAEAGETLAMIRRSVGRMADLIGNVLDFARGRLGGGIPVHRAPTATLAATLEQVCAELRAASPQHTIECRLSIPRPVNCDAARIAQMLSNLLGNALTHGDASGLIRVRAGIVAGDADADAGGSRDPRDSGHGDTFELAVANHGPTIPPQVMSQLFQPFARGSARPGQQGLGLGLYIAAEIARAHCGTLGVVSADGVTTFTFRMPASAA
jgi:signal transduction histidine kinase